MKTLTLSSKTLHRFCRTCLIQLDASSCRVKHNFRELKLSQWLLKVAFSSTQLELSQKQTNRTEKKNETEDKLPKFLCQQCYEKLQSCNDFCSMSRRSAQKCQELLATEQQLQAAVSKLETSEEMEEQLLVAQEHEQVLNEIYGNRDWLEFDSDYTNKKSPTVAVRQQKLSKLKKLSKKTSKRSVENHAETTDEEMIDERKLVMSSLLGNEEFFNEPSSSSPSANYKQNVILVDGTQQNMEAAMHENNFEFLDSDVIKERDILEDNEINDTEEAQQAAEAELESDAEAEEFANSLTHESDDEEYKSENESDFESNDSESLLEMQNKFKRKNLPAAPANSLSSIANTSNNTKTTTTTSSGGDNKKFQCEHCPSRFKNQANLEAHRRTHLGLKAFQCGECTRSFNKAYGLRLHMREQHTDEGLKTEITCAYEGCGKLFRRVSTYKAHYRVKHTRDLVANPRPPAKTFVCEVCGRTFKNMTTLKEHRYKHAPAEEYPYQCADCGKRYTSHRVYKEHLMRHAGIKDYVCPYCGMRKTTRNELRTHINYHTKERQWPCPHCPSVFNNSANLGMHDRVVHKGIRRYACRYCELTFGKPDTLKHHEMRHTGERPHTCQVCGKGFIQIVALRAHMKTHNKNSARAAAAARGGGGGGVDGVDVGKQPTELVEPLVHHDQRREMASACLQLVKDLTELHGA